MSADPQLLETLLTGGGGALIGGFLYRLGDRRREDHHRWVEEKRDAYLAAFAALGRARGLIKLGMQADDPTRLDIAKLEADFQSEMSDAHGHMERLWMLAPTAAYIALDDARESMLAAFPFEADPVHGYLGRPGTVDRMERAHRLLMIARHQARKDLGVRHRPVDHAVRGLVAGRGLLSTVKHPFRRWKTG